jgi:hypothetical protein
MDPQLQFTLVYSAGLLAWIVMWRLMVGRGWLRRERLLHIPFWGGVLVLGINILLAATGEMQPYAVEIGVYGFVETNSITIGGFSLGIAVFVVFTFDKAISPLQREESRKFLQLVFSAFLLAVIGVLPLYWVPQTAYAITLLKHLKTIPFTWSAFTLAAAIVIYIRLMRIEMRRAREETAASISEDAPTSPVDSAP